jgi:hypothetical protein
MRASKLVIDQSSQSNLEKNLKSFLSTNSSTNFLHICCKLVAAEASCCFLLAEVAEEEEEDLAVAGRVCV